MGQVTTISTPSQAPGNLALIAEFLVLFVALPLAFRFKPFPFPPIPALWLVMAYCLFRLRSDASFKRRALWSPESFPPLALQIALTFLAIALLLGLSVYFLRPQLLFNFVRRAPIFWGVVMLLYPVLSVYPQGIIYRAFFFHRYRGLFPGTLQLILASAVAFAFVHIIFRNPLAVAFTFIGGLLFAWRYQETGSLFTSSLEHALYGCLMFTIGLGEYFYKGAR
jgi:membrane protease YdiL (CAAX protease family)